MRAVNAINGRADIERACAERIARSALHMLGKIRLALEHFRRRAPVWPLFLVGDGMDAVPGVAVAADAHAVPQRTIGTENEIELALLREDDDRARFLLGFETDFLPVHLQH